MGGTFGARLQPCHQNLFHQSRAPGAGVSYGRPLRRGGALLAPAVRWPASGPGFLRLEVVDISERRAQRCAGRRALRGVGTDFGRGDGGRRRVGAAQSGPVLDGVPPEGARSAGAHVGPRASAGGHQRVRHRHHGRLRPRLSRATGCGGARAVVTQQAGLLAGATLGLYGFGGIAQRVARVALALDMSVVAMRRRDLPSPVEGVAMTTRSAS